MYKDPVLTLLFLSSNPPHLHPHPHPHPLFSSLPTHHVPITRLLQPLRQPSLHQWWSIWSHCHSPPATNLITIQPSSPIPKAILLTIHASTHAARRPIYPSRRLHPTGTWHILSTATITSRLHVLQGGRPSDTRPERHPREKERRWSVVSPVVRAGGMWGR